MDRLVASPACLPGMALEPLLAEYRKLGFKHFEMFTSWCDSHVAWTDDPQAVLAIGGQYGFDFTSMHLPAVSDDPASFEVALASAEFAAELGSEVVLFKADSRENYIAHGSRFIDAIEAKNLGLTPVVQNHKGTAITTLDDYAHVLDGLDDPRMKIVLEVGHFQRAGQDWHVAVDRWADRIGLVHINQIDDANASVPYDQGNIDFADVLATLDRIGNTSRIVVELELEGRREDPGPTLHYLGEALDLLHEAAGIAK